MEWEEQAIGEARPVLERTARDRSAIAYSDLTSHIHVVPLEPDSDALARVLDQISTASDGEGKGMLSAVVIHKTGDYLPGNGFFELALKLGRDPADREIFYAEELKRVYAAYAA